MHKPQYPGGNIIYVNFSEASFLVKYFKRILEFTF